MKRLAILTTAATLLLSTAAFAAPHHQGTDHYRTGPQQSHQQRYDYGRTADRDRQSTHRVRRANQVQAAWRYGEPVNWHALRLRQPPVGYHWVRTEGGYLLVRISGGPVLGFAYIR